MKGLGNVFVLSLPRFTRLIVLWIGLSHGESLSFVSVLAIAASTTSERRELLLLLKLFVLVVFALQGLAIRPHAPFKILLKRLGNLPAYR